ncbi:MAG TPA: acylglycerol kinase family protein, partial [Candidatus Ozemobacteraceae bacterium]|nr:acylglycerol kinase family protein [Candidatus Ozemobacteraceae bacterium]
MPLRRVVVVANPRAGLRVGGALNEAIELLKRHVETQVEYTRHAGHAEQLARDLGADPDTLVAVCGGDGTLNEALNGIPSRGVLGLLPAGTANVVARELGIPLNLREAAKVVAGRKVASGV